MIPSSHRSTLRGCTRCGEVVRVDSTHGPEKELRCPECHKRIEEASSAHGALSRQRTAAFALAALMLYPAAVLLPVLRVEQLGTMHEAGILDGAVDLLSEGYLLLGMLIVVCSVLIPIAKLLGLLLLSTRRIPVSTRQRARAWWFIEISGRWGMLDVLLVAALVAFVKLGDVIEIQPGEGAILFALVVALSLFSAMAFDPNAIRVRIRDAHA